VSAAQHLGYVMMLRPEVEEAHVKLRKFLLSLARQPDGLQRMREVAANAPDYRECWNELVVNRLRILINPAMEPKQFVWPNALAI